ncbi:hypothetical protein BV22DRAFT_1059561 [Leucogyrophana mollusca]|uniref:Uncharacterized protein n=1 Tax=Leucogyrophana mollusca TaxID=85980 RepID=A0ACB8BS12_9AGAM|nr:hypothetical protein BV22DRAFT_1059561 [Leucogyrophana mollusca]
MSIPSTKTLDHIVHLTPPGTVDEVSRQFRDLGFNVIPGGTHAGGLTANALVILQDGVYLELISFTHPASHYPPGSPDRAKRDANPWAWKSLGWIDYAFLGSSKASIANIINDRAGTHIYEPEVEGGRVRGDGKVLKWVISAPGEELGRGSTPFFCGDVTPRELRVPIDPPSNAEHPSGVLGIAYVRVLVGRKALSELSSQLQFVVGEEAILKTNTQLQWELKTPSGSGSTRNPRLVLSIPTNEEEEVSLKDRGPGIAEVAFWTGDGGKAGEAVTPYGKVVWLRPT